MRTLPDALAPLVQINPEYVDALIVPADVNASIGQILANHVDQSAGRNGYGDPLVVLVDNANGRAV